MADQSFKDFVLDQLSAFPDVRAKAMFGGHGLYQREHFFAILAEGRLYFKTDEASRVAFVERTMEPFTYEQAGRKTTMHYFEVPSDVLENREDLSEWARRAVAVAEAQGRGQSRKPTNAGKSKARS